MIGAGSESFRTVFYLVRRLPVMITPRWVTTRTQPIAIADVVAYLAAAADLAPPLDREIQIGGPDVTTYGGMIDELAMALDRRPPLRITVPVLTPRLSSLWIGLVTPVDAGVARPLIEGLATETVVSDPSGMELLLPVIRADAIRQLRCGQQSNRRDCSFMENIVVPSKKLLITITPRKGRDPLGSPVETSASESAAQMDADSARAAGESSVTALASAR